MQEIKIIIGASYGDEGKGLAADYFGSRGSSDLVDLVNVLTNGGPQRGHTVEMPDGLRHVFKHFGAASFRGATSYFDRQFLVNPMEFVREYEELSSIHKAPMVFMHPDCRFTTPWDMMVNQMLREKKGIHNSCGYGIWETVLRYQRGWGISFDTFAKMTMDDRLAYLRRIRDLYFYERIREIENNRVEPAGKTPETASFCTGTHNPFENFAAGLPYFRDMADCFFSEELLYHFEEDCECMRRLCPARPESFLKHFRTVIFENAQGLLLDGNLKKEEEFTTPSTTGIGKVFQTVERVFRGADAEVCYITRSYLTRHGDGPMENEIKGNQLRDQLPGVGADVTNVENSFQGRLRYGMMDADLLVKRIQEDYARACGSTQNHYRSSLMVTHMNEYAGVDTGLLADRFGTLYLSGGRTGRDVMTYSTGHRYCAVHPLSFSRISPRPYEVTGIAR